MSSNKSKETSNQVLVLEKLKKELEKKEKDAVSTRDAAEKEDKKYWFGVVDGYRDAIRLVESWMK